MDDKETAPHPSNSGKKRPAAAIEHDEKIVDDGDECSFPAVDEEIMSETPEVYYPPGTVFHPPDARGTHFTYTNQMKGYVQILQFLDKHNAPKYAFDELMEIVRLMSIQNFDFRQVHPKRKTVMGHIRSQFVPPDYERIPVQMERDEGDPEVSPCCTPEMVHVYRFNLEHQIKELLEEEIFKDASNLVVNPLNPYGKYVPPGNRYDEIHSGDWYCRTYDERIKDPNNEVLLALKIYIDKTGCDPMLQRHGLEPVMFTFTIIKRGVQQDCKRAWRHIGFIPDLDQRPKSESAYSSSNDARRGRSTRNYHSCLRVLLQPLYALQKTGMNVFLRIGNYVKEVQGHFPVAMIIGDAKSQDALCCRVPHYDQPRMSRACYTSFSDCCKPDHKCVWVKQKHQEQLSSRCADPQSRKDPIFLAKLRSVSTVRCSSSLFEMDFGDNLYGQFRACTVDPMHLFEGGWCANVAKAFVRPLRSRVRFELDILLERIRVSSRSSVRDRFPRINFSGGVTSMTQIASHEWPGVILAYLIAIQMPQGQKLLTSRLEDDETKFQKKITQTNVKAKFNKARESVLRRHQLLSVKDRMAIQKRRRQKDHNNDASSSSDDEDGHSSCGEESSSDCDDHFIIMNGTEKEGSNNQTRCTLENIVQLFEMMLCFHAFYKNSTYWKIGDRRSYNRFKDAVQALMKQLVITLNRGDKTHNWNTQKTHEILHFADQICEYGHIMNADTGVGERGLKDWAKKAARRALKGSIDVFTDSTTRQVVDTLTLRKAAEVMNVGDHMFCYNQRHTRAPLPEKEAISQEMSGMLVGEPKFKIVGRFVDGTVQTEVKWFGCTAKKNSSVVHPKIVELVEEEYFWEGEDNATNERDNGTTERVIFGYTEYQLPCGNLVRAHPNFRSEGPFYDWCIVPDPNEEHDYAVEHISVRKVPESLHRCKSLSLIEQKWGRNHVPCRVLALYKHPENGTPMAIIHPCRPWMEVNNHKSSVITEHWNLQCSLVNFYKRPDGTLSERNGPGRTIVRRYLPMYHLVEAKSIKEVVFGVQENGVFPKFWNETGGNVIIISDRYETWGDCFEDFK
jgi:hypothetical protein